MLHYPKVGLAAFSVGQSLNQTNLRHQKAKMFLCREFQWVVSGVGPAYSETGHVEPLTSSLGCVIPCVEFETPEIDQEVGNRPFLSIIPRRRWVQKKDLIPFFYYSGLQAGV